MKSTLYLIVATLLLSCDASHHIQKMQKHKLKAEQKGAKFEKETEYKYIFETDTITDTLTNEVEIIKRVVDSIPYEREKLIYVPLSRQERKALKDSMNHELKKAKLELSALKSELNNERKINKDNNRKANRSEKNAVKMERAKHYAWWVWFLIGFFSCFCVGIYLKFKK